MGLYMGYTNVEQRYEGVNSDDYVLTNKIENLIDESGVIAYDDTFKDENAY